jgi:hypothetical protein
MKNARDRLLCINMDSKSAHGDDIHIHLKNTEDAKCAKVIPDAFQQYVIEQNKTLQQENRAYRDQIKDQEFKLEELEDEADKHDASKRYIKGLLKNFVIVDEMRETICNLEHKTTDETFVTIHMFKVRAYKHLRFLEMLMALLAALAWEYADSSSVMVLYPLLLAVAAFQESTLANLVVVENRERRKSIKSREKEIKEISRSQEFIHEHIDSL